MSQTIEEREQAWALRADACQEHIADLGKALRELQSANEAQSAALKSAQRLSSPAVPVFQGIVVLPLIGQISRERAESIMANLLSGIETYDARVAIVDITGVAEMDEQSTLVLLRAAQAAELMGCQLILTGLRPELAHALVRAGADTARLITRGDLEDGLRFGLAKLGLSVSKHRKDSSRQRTKMRQRSVGV
jgi:rsbT co-antagonist protein RsbR